VSPNVIAEHVTRYKVTYCKSKIKKDRLKCPKMTTGTAGHGHYKGCGKSHGTERLKRKKALRRPLKTRP